MTTTTKIQTRFWILSLGLVLVIGAGFWFWLFFKQPPKSSPPPIASYELQRTIRYSFTVKNSSPSLLLSADVWAYAPVKRTATQHTLALETSPPHTLSSDQWGNQIMHFQLKNLPPFGTRIIRVTATLEVSSRPNKSDQLPDPQFLLPQKYIESDHPELLAQAKKLRSENDMSGRSIFLWISNTLTHESYIAKDRGALFALGKKQGDCTEHAYLFTALARAKKIPARTIGGYKITGDGLLQGRNYHNWAEFYDGNAWQLVDPFDRVYMNRQEEYIAFRIIAPNKASPLHGFHRFRAEGKGLMVVIN